MAKTKTVVPGWHLDDPIVSEIRWVHGTTLAHEVARARPIVWRGVGAESGRAGDPPLAVSMPTSTRHSGVRCGPCGSGRGRGYDGRSPNGED
jgi:hypothetical protein